MKFSPCVAGIVIAAISASLGSVEASADVFKVDAFSVSRNGSKIFSDNFGAGTTLLPPSTASGVNFTDNNAPGTYFVNGTIPEVGNQALLNPANGTSNGTSSLIFVALDTGGATSSHVLGPTQTFSATATFDLTVPAHIGGYDVFLSNRVTAGGTGETDLLRTEKVSFGDFVVLLQFTFVNNTLTTQKVVQAAFLDPAHQQIQTTLFYNGANSVTASFDYIDGGVPGATTTFANTAQFFTAAEGNNFAVPGFEAFQAVAEPGSLTVLAIGVIGLVAARRQRKRDPQHRTSERAEKTPD